MRKGPIGDVGFAEGGRSGGGRGKGVRMMPVGDGVRALGEIGGCEGGRGRGRRGGGDDRVFVGSVGDTMDAFPRRGRLAATRVAGVDIRVQNLKYL